MGKIDRFEALVAWQKARMLTQAIYEATHRKGMAQDYGPSNQMQPSVVRMTMGLAHAD